MGFWKCVIYMAALGVLSFVIGRLLPKSWFHADRFPYKTAACEPKIYQALRVKSWQSKVPDMSRIFKKIMPMQRVFLSFPDVFFYDHIRTHALEIRVHQHFLLHS